MKRIGLLVLLAALIIIPAASTGAQSQSEEILALAGNNAGDSVLVTLIGGTNVWVTERPHDSATDYHARDAVCTVERATVTVCGHYAYVAVSCGDWPVQTFVFELRTTFPCAQPSTVYIPLVSK